MAFKLKTKFTKNTIFPFPLRMIEGLMDISGRYPFPAPPELVWETICDPEALKACIPQCTDIKQLSPTAWEGQARVKVGPFGVNFEGFITLLNMNPPHSYTLAITAKSWVGTSEGHADVVLTPENGGTMLSYNGRVTVGIKLLDKAMDKAEGLARHLADAFFARLADVVAERKAKQQENPPHAAN